MSEIHEQLRTLRKLIAKLDGEVVELAEHAPAEPSKPPEPPTRPSQPVHGPAHDAGSGPIGSLFGEGAPPDTMPVQAPGLKEKIIEKAGEAIAEKAIEKVNERPVVGASGAVVHPCGFSGEVSVVASGFIEPAFWWNATDGEISDYAPIANGQAKDLADAQLATQLGALMVGGCAAPCKAGVQMMGDATYSYEAKRTKVDPVSTYVRYTCTVTQRVKLNCAQ